MTLNLFRERGTSLRLRGKIARSLRQTFSTAFHMFSSDSDAEQSADCRAAALGMMRSVMERDGVLSDEALEAFRALLSDDHSQLEIEHLVSLLRRQRPLSAEEAAPCFTALPDAEKLQLIRSLLVLSLSSGQQCKNETLIREFAEKLGFPPEELRVMSDEVEAAQKRRRRIIRSGAGILVALIVIAVFILTATLLRSVIFGLIAAYIMLPVEKHFERRLRAKRGMGYYFFRLVGCLLAPLRNLAGKIRKWSNTEQEDRSPDAEKLRAERTIITQAVGLTSALILIVLIAIVIILSSVTNHYVHNLSNSVRNWTSDKFNSASKVSDAATATAAATATDETTAASEQEPAPAASAPLPAEMRARDDGRGTRGPGRASLELAADSAEQMVEQLQLYLDRLRTRFENLPLVTFGLDQVSVLLNDKDAQRELAGILLRRTGGIFSFTASVLGAIGAILADLLLATFFFLLFLTKLAEFCTGGCGFGRQSEYLVRTVFNGNWLPGANEDTIREAQRIIGDVMDKLRTWVRGYLTLMLVDVTVYTTMFYFLRVPYFPVLGALAGCGILLPYIGPILSAVLTLLVTLAVGGSDVGSFQLLGIVGTYLIYNGVIEQFILYPAVIGESLGLTTLETIIVVLLGAIFAGIPGMILSIPAASVMKYLVPQIYKCWEPETAKTENTET